MIRSHVGGLVYLNGRLAGETDAKCFLTLPVSPVGVVFVEFRPFVLGFLPVAVRLSLSGGEPILPVSDPRLCAACWPNGLIELELRPERMGAPPQRLFTKGEILFSYIDAFPPVLRCDAQEASFFHSLPNGALPPVVRELPSGLLFTGALPDEEEYALLLSKDASRVLMTLTGRNICVLGDASSVRVLHLRHDTVGHAFLETWKETSEGWRLEQSEPMWAEGMPSWPQTPADTALAVIEAAQLGLSAEAAAYCSPRFECMSVLSRLGEWDGCAPLRMSLPDGTDAVSVTRLDGGLLRAAPVRYIASPGGTHGLWQIDWMETP